MIPEELLKPRFKVIADYPDSPFVDGQILVTRVGNFGKQVFDIYRQFGNDDFVYPESYPHLFKKLAYYEDRNIKDLPKYIVNNTAIPKTIHEVIDWNIHDDEIVIAVTNEGSFYAWGTVPATQSEYLAFKNKTS